MPRKKQNERNHDRASGITQTSVALPVDLLKRLNVIAKAEMRSRNNLITLFLDDGCKRFWKGKD